MCDIFYLPYNYLNLEFKLKKYQNDINFYSFFK